MRNPGGEPTVKKPCSNNNKQAPVQPRSLGFFSNFAHQKDVSLLFGKKYNGKKWESSKTGEVSTKDSAAMKDPYTNRLLQKTRGFQKTCRMLTFLGC